MFVYVEPLFFHTGGDAQAMYDVKSFEDHESHEGGPASDYGGSEKLCQQEVCTARVEKALFGGKQSGQYGSEESADTVYGRGSDRIVDFQDMVDKVDSIDHDRSADGPDQDGSGRRHQVATGSDTYQACQYTVECQRQRRFFIFHPGYDQREESSGAGSQVGGQEYVGDCHAVAFARSGQL